MTYFDYATAYGVQPIQRLGMPGHNGEIRGPIALRRMRMPFHKMMEMVPGKAVFRLDVPDVAHTQPLEFLSEILL